MASVYGFDLAALGRLALKIGADVPFFLDPRPARVGGVGERITYLKGAVRLAPGDRRAAGCRPHCGNLSPSGACAIGADQGQVGCPHRLMVPQSAPICWSTIWKRWRLRAIHRSAKSGGFFNISGQPELRCRAAEGRCLRFFRMPAKRRGPRSRRSRGCLGPAFLRLPWLTTAQPDDLMAVVLVEVCERS